MLLPMLLLLPFAAGHALSALLFRLYPARSPPPPDDRAAAVTVLIPARDEGAGALRAARSVLDQDHAGPVTAILLVRDGTDSAVALLGGPAHLPPGEPVEVWRAGDRRLLLCGAGSDPKHLKINLGVRLADTPWVAILDADHAARPGWLSTSLAVQRQTGAQLVQSRRWPLGGMDGAGLPGLWDSLHQHIGCEVQNVAWSRLDLPVFFTGSTALIDRDLLLAHPLAPGLTEDTDLSCRLLLRGVRCAYNPHSGSEEEVSPDLYSFLARRRRWAHGHTAAFFGHTAPGVWSAPIPLRSRLQLLYHGLHYLLAAAVLATQAGAALAVLPRLTGGAALAAAGAAGLAAWTLLQSQRSGQATPQATSQATSRAGGSGAAVLLWLWWFPALVLAINLGTALALGEPEQAMLPLPRWLNAAMIAGMITPLALLIAGLHGYGLLTAARGLRVALSWPGAFLLDISGVLIGLADLIAGQRRWLAITRAGSPGDTMKGDTGSSRMQIGRAAPWLALAGLVAAGVALALPERVPLAARACQILEADTHPWIVPAAELPGWCGPAAPAPPRYGQRTGTFAGETPPVDLAGWDRLDDTFPCNLAKFTPRNVLPLDGGGVRLRLQPEQDGDRALTAGSIATPDRPDARFLYGRFEVTLRPIRASGVLTAFFLYRFDPWQEIDMEFPGRDTTKALINVYYNPGEAGDRYNYGYRGTPVLVDLGFDAADGPHTYAIEWDPQEIRWFADGALIHTRRSGQPTPVPHLPMRFHINAWPICAADLAGPLDTAALPAAADIRAVRLSRWSPPLLDGALGGPGWLLQGSGGWRDQSAWIQPGR